MNASTAINVIIALGVGGILQALVGYVKDRKKVASDTEKTDVETKLAYLNTVIERLDSEAKRALADRDRIQEELIEEQNRSATLRKRVRELEDEIDAVRRSTRDTENKCVELATRLKELVDDVQEKE